MTGLAKLTATELRLLARDRASLILPMLLPLGLLAGFGSSDFMREELPEMGGMTAFDAFIVPVALLLVIATLAISVFPVTLASYRERGVLRRLATTPAKPAALLVAQAAVHLALLITTLSITSAVAVQAFGAAVPRAPLVTLGVVAGAALAMYALGLTVAALAGRSSTATAAGWGLLFPQLLLGGMMVPAEQLPAALAQVGRFTPIGAAREALQAAWAGAPTGWSIVLILTTWTATAAVVAVVRFRWG